MVRNCWIMKAKADILGVLTELLRPPKKKAVVSAPVSFPFPEERWRTSLRL